MQPRLIAILTACLAAGVTSEESGRRVVTFVNEFPDKTIELFWEDHEKGIRRKAGKVEPRGAYINVETTVGHEFSYVVDNQRHFVVPSNVNSNGGQFVSLFGSEDGVQVRCELSDVGERGTAEKLDIMIKPYWSPMGATRFLELVRQGYFDGVALNRVVPKFLTQFGIAKDVGLRRKFEKEAFPDDSGENRKFRPGYMSFAGNGVDSRTTEVFIVMPGAPHYQLNHFGQNSWETPFGYVEAEDLEVLTRIKAYGDVPPFGEGPDSARIYDEDGYAYLEEKFPDLDYLDTCYVVAERISDEL
mmetsp:Transcript_23096/g.51528  ORF Transcript_23096/g.51528 Transcript_23096/m.51528 type:complete len:301 (+) Transcript_23096:92-994(+)